MLEDAKPTLSHIYNYIITHIQVNEPEWFEDWQNKLNK